ncbi:WD40/YVTN/BNR-like repeat-containing protein [Paenibacillus xanthanilyticus]|uniref:WD40/YVTN/BNR-like repeat-containing protein n=1 Tax=Paenibacillus xanthanilyticus TaxID=1783531 RepID=A0ABV8K3C9_9BACL
MKECIRTKGYHGAHVVRRDGRGLIARLCACMAPALLAAALVPAHGDHDAAAAGCRTDDHGIQLTADVSGESPHFTSIQFLNVSTGRAAGNGFMLGTSDGGCRWQSIYKGKLTFAQMDFVTNSLGYVLARTAPDGPAMLLRTANGGASYKPVPNGGHRLARIDFRTALEGFGYAFNDSGAYYTADAGAKWSKLPTPPNTRGAQFFSPKEGWAVALVPGGYQVKRTTDGGRTWTTRLTAASAAGAGGAVYGANSRDVWILLYGGSGMSQTSYSLFHTKDGGASWEQVVSNATAGGGPAPGPVAKAGKLPGPPGRPSDLATPDPRAAYLLTGSGAMDNLSLGRTQNGGKTWRNSAAVPGFEGKLSFPSAKSGWLAVTSLTGSAVYATRDGGATWSKTFAIAVD